MSKAFPCLYRAILSLERFLSYYHIFSNKTTTSALLRSRLLIRPISFVDPKTAQTLARHLDISLTKNIDSHIAEEDQIEAINSLPSIPGTKKPHNEDENGACVPA